MAARTLRGGGCGREIVSVVSMADEMTLSSVDGCVEGMSDGVGSMESTGENGEEAGGAGVDSVEGIGVKEGMEVNPGMLESDGTAESDGIGLSTGAGIGGMEAYVGVVGGVV